VQQILTYFRNSITRIQCSAVNFQSFIEDHPTVRRTCCYITLWWWLS